MSTDFDVIIVGGGPVGLLLACLLKKLGLRLRVLEKRTQPIAHSAAIGITPPSLQILKKLGLTEEFINNLPESVQKCMSDLNSLHEEVCELEFQFRQEMRELERKVCVEMIK